MKIPIVPYPLSVFRLSVVLLSVFLFSCTGGDISKVKPGMEQEEVIKIMGNPDDVVPISIADSTGQTESMVIWQYGHNQGILINGGKVHQVIDDIDKVLRDFQNAM